MTEETGGRILAGMTIYGPDYGVKWQSGGAGQSSSLSKAYIEAAARAGLGRDVLYVYGQEGKNDAR